MIPVEPEKFTSHDVATVKISDFATPEEQKSVSIGDDVISAGLVPTFLGEKRNYPFFKFGKVSSIPDEDTLMPCASGAPRPHTVWYLAATLIGGNSGSPIFILPPGNLLISMSNTRPFFVGLQTIAGEIAGMTPSQYIFEILDWLHLQDANMSRGLAPKVQPTTK